MGGTTVSQADNVFTITGSSNSADAGSFSLSFTASDGTNLTTTTPSEFTLSFGMDWSTLDYTPGATNLGAHEPSYDYFGQSLASDDNYIGVAASRADGQTGVIRFYDHDFNYVGQIFDNLKPGGPNAFGGWYLAGDHWLAMDNGKVAFPSRNHSAVDVWDFGTNPSSPTLLKVMKQENFGHSSESSGYWGVSGDLRGNYLIVGDSSWNGSKGKVWVFDISQGAGIEDDSSSGSLLYTLDSYNDAGPIGAAGDAITFGAAIAIADNGTFAVSAPGDTQNTVQGWYGGSVFIYNITDGSLVTTINTSHYGLPDFGNDRATPRAPANDQKELAISSDGSRIVVGDQTIPYSGSYNQRGCVAVYDVSTGNRIYVQRPYERGVSDTNSRFGQRVDISPEGTHVVWSAYDNGSNDEGTVWIDDIDNPSVYTNGPLSGSAGLTGVSAFGTAVHFTKNKVLASSQVNDKVWYYD